MDKQNLRSHYTACMHEIAHLDRLIGRLQLRLRQGSPYHHLDLEQVARHRARRQDLAAQRQAFTGRLTADSDETLVVLPLD